MADFDIDTTIDDLNYSTLRRRKNQNIFWISWSIILAVFLVCGARQVSKWWRRRRRCRFHNQEPSCDGKAGPLARGTAFVEALLLLPLPRASRFVDPGLTLGRATVLIIFVALIGRFFTSVQGPTSPEHFLDDVAFRAAWVTLTQIPIVFLLSAKRGPINAFMGLSYERINWLHKWVGRVMFTSVTTHVVIMKSSISTDDIVHSHEPNMNVVRWGIGAYSILLWVVITSIWPLRRWSYWAFYISHWSTTIVFLAVVFQHVPKYARSPIYLALSLAGLDKGLTFYDFCCKNFSVRPLRRFGRFAQFSRGPGRNTLVAGFPVEMTAPSASIIGLPLQVRDTTTVIQINNIPFSWKPGQHIRLYIPGLRAMGMHPFTPANCAAIPPPPLPPRGDVERRGSTGLFTQQQPPQTSNMLLMVRAHSGFTQRLAEYHEEWLSHPCPNASEASSTLTAYVDGPYGNVPDWEDYENIIMVGTSTGVSFLLSIMDHLEQLCFLDKTRWTTKTITFIWIRRHIDPPFDQIVEDSLLRYGSMLRESGIRLEVEIYTTCLDSKDGSELAQYDPFAHLRLHTRSRLFNKPQLTIRHPDEIYDEWDREAAMEALGQQDDEPFMDSSGWQSFESDDGSEISTLVDDCDEVEDDPFSDVFAAVGEDAAYRPLPSPQPRPRESSRDRTDQTRSKCQCNLIQHQRRKLKIRTASQDLISREFALRPDLRCILSGAIPRTGNDKTMVTVCANQGIARDVRGLVAKMNIDYALGRRATKVDIFTESFGQ